MARSWLSTTAYYSLLATRYLLLATCYSRYLLLTRKQARDPPVRRFQAACASRQQQQDKWLSAGRGRAAG